VRATPQWFADVGPLRAKAEEALLGGDVTMHPPVSAARLRAMLAGRDAWCISRQRAWGVPIPVCYDRDQGMAPV